MGAKRLTQANCSCGLALAERSGSDGCHIDIFAIWTLSEAVQDLKLDLGFVRAEQFEFIFANAKFRRDLQDRLEFSSLCDLNIGRHRPQKFEFGCDEGNLFSIC